MQMPNPCPDADELEGYLLGRVEEPEVDRLQKHLAACEYCLDTIHHLQTDDTLVRAMQAQAKANTGPEADRVEQVVQHLSGLNPVFGNPAADTQNFRASESQAGEQRATSLDFLHPPQSPDEIGRLGGYRVFKVLGTGGMGVVFEAEDPQLRRRVALKAMKPSRSENDSNFRRFLREAQAVAAMEHDHIVAIYQVGEDRGTPFLAMPLLRGESLEDRLPSTEAVAPSSSLAVFEILRIGREIAEGLAAAHQRGLTHRDIKPANIWLEAGSGRVKLLDFGLARPDEDEAHLTQAGTVAGTPHYMAPEQAAGEVVDQRCDLFSLGCVLYRLCTGQLPFRGSNTMAVLRATALEQPKPVRTFNSAVPRALAELVVQLLAKNPRDRPPTARAVVDAIKAIEAEAQQQRDTQTRTGRRAAWITAMVLVLAGAGYQYGGTVYRFATNQGELIIETNDPDVEITARGEQVRIIDVKTGGQVNLKAGKYQIELTKGAGLELSTNEFTLERGGRQIVHVRLAPAANGAYQKAAKADAAPEEAGWKQLFNGKDLTGWWHTNWKVEQGLLVGKDEAHLHSPSVYEDFHVRIKARYNADCQGTFVFGDSARNVFVRIGNQLPQKTGAVIDFARPTASVIGPYYKELVPPDTWFDLEVIVRDQRIIAKVNGLVTADKTLDTMPERGAISLYAAPGSELHVEKFEIKGLPAGELTRAAGGASPMAADAAPEEPGWTQLFNGKDLTGWAKTSTNWNVEHGLLVGKDQAYLHTAASYEDFHVRIKARYNADCQGTFTFGNSARNMSVRIGNKPLDHKTGAVIDFARPTASVIGPYAQELVPPDTWFELEVIVQGNHIIAKVNGLTTADKTLDTRPERGNISLATTAPGSQLHVEKFEIKDLSAMP